MQPVQTLDDLSAMSRAHQQAYVQALEAMIDRGYIHMDNHVGNLGTIAGRPVLFDFGFTQKRAGMDRRWALCFSVFQILEHCPPQILKGTLFYRVVAGCLYGGPRERGARPAGDPLADCITIRSTCSAWPKKRRHERWRTRTCTSAAGPTRGSLAENWKTARGPCSSSAMTVDAIASLS